MAVDLVAVWDVPCSDGVHQVEVEHGTISGRRIIKVDGQVRCFDKDNSLLFITYHTHVNHHTTSRRVEGLT